MHHEILPLLHVIKHLTSLVESLEKHVIELGHKIDDIITEIHEEYSVSSDEEESESESDESELSVGSAPATFSYKVQRTQ